MRVSTWADKTPVDIMADINALLATWPSTQPDTIFVPYHYIFPARSGSACPTSDTARARRWRARGCARHAVGRSAGRYSTRRRRKHDSVQSDE